MSEPLHSPNNANGNAPSETEAEWQEQVVHLAHIFGWQHLHVRRAIGKKKQWVTATNIKGWPDLFLWHERLGTAAIELKVRPNTATPEQLKVLDSLRSAGVKVMVAYPSDFEAVRALLERGIVAIPMPAVAS